jgi:hypothetical protein
LSVEEDAEEREERIGRRIEETRSVKRKGG